MYRWAVYIQNDDEVRDIAVLEGKNCLEVLVEARRRFIVEVGVCIGVRREGTNPPDLGIRKIALSNSKPSTGRPRRSRKKHVYEPEINGLQDLFVPAKL